MKEELAELQERCARLSLLYHVSKVIHSTLDAAEALRLILREAVRLTGASGGSVVLLNPTTGLLEIEASLGLPAEAAARKLDSSRGLAGWVIRHGAPVRVGDVSQDARCLAGRAEVRSELAVPLEVAGQIRGVLNVDATRTDAFGARDQELLEELALQAAKVIHNTWLYEQLRLKARLFESLISVGRTITSTLNLDEALQAITREACLLMEAKMSSVLLLDRDTGEWLDLRASHGAGPAYLGKPRLRVEESLLGVVVRRRKPLQVENVQQSSRYQLPEIAQQEGLVSLLSVPLIHGGQAIGTLNVYTGQRHSFSNEEIQILSALAALSAIAIQKARLYERIMNVEEELRQNERLSALGLLAAEVAHEIRNPLTVMKMLYHSLDLQFPPGDPRAQDAAVMGQKIDQLNKIVEQVLDFARGSEPRFIPVDVNDLIADLSLLTRHKLQNQSIGLVLRLAPIPLRVSGDATHLEQAFLNLTLNAVQAMPRGGTLTITTRPVPSRAKSTRPTQLLIEFRDTGEGMTTEQAGRLFGSILSTTKPKGTGLGLAIVRRVLETHRGEIKINSAPGRGTAIRLLLPLLGEPPG